MGVKLGNGKWAIKEDKLLAYNDNSGRFFNKEFDFSRGSSATYVAKDGLIKTAGLQETNLVNNGDFSELGSELITNGDFSDGETGWTKGGATSATQEVVNSALVMYSGSASDANNSLSRTNTPQGYNGKIYKLELTVSDMLVSPTGFIRLDSVYDASNIISFGTGTSTIYFTAYRDFTHIRFFAGSAEDGYTIDNVSVKQVDPNDYWTLGTGWSIGDGVAICDGTDGVNLSQNGVIENGKTYKIKLDVNLTSGILLLRVGLSYSTDLTISESGSYQIIVVSDGTNFILRSGVFNGSITNISVQEIQTDTPRIDFSDSVKGALLLEPESTNLITYSEDFSDSSWVKNGFGNALAPVVTLNSNISPDGAQNASRIQMDCTSNLSSDYSAIYQQLALDGSSEYTISFYIKSNTSSEQDLLFFSNSSFSTQITANSEWQRVESTFTSNSTNTRNFGLVAKGSVQQDVDVLIYGAQLEQLSYATSYIPTAGSSATRLADVCNNSGSAQDFSKEGVLYADISALSDDQTNRRITISDGTNTNRVVMGYNTNSNQIFYFVVVGNSTVASGNYTSSDITQFSKVAIKFKANDFALWVDGIERHTDTSGIIFSENTLTSLQFEQGSGNSLFFYGKVRAVQVFTEALTDEQLQKLTTI